MNILEEKMCHGLLKLKRPLKPFKKIILKIIKSLEFISSLIECL